LPADIGQLSLWAALLLLAALFVMVRSAISAADTGSFEKMVHKVGGGWAERVLETVERPRRFIIGADVWAVGLGVFLMSSVYHFVWGLWYLDTLLRKGDMLYVVVPRPPFLSFIWPAVLVFVIALLIARQIGARRPFAVLRRLFWPIWLLTMALWPLCWVLDKIALPGLKPGAETVETSEEEILDLIDQGSESGDIEAQEREMIENIFEMGNQDAEDVMVHRTDMVIVWEEDTEAEILETIRSSGLSRFPVCGEDVDDVIGILSTRDYLLNYRLDAPRPLRELLRAAYFVPESVKADALFREMQRQKVHMAIVVDEYGGTSGLLTMEDLLEELVGEIYDEFDGEEDPDLIQVSEGRWRVRGSAPLWQVAEALGVGIPESEDYDTLGGLIFSGLTVIPDDGNHPEMTVFGLRIVVEELLDRRVEWATVEQLGEAEEA